MIKMRDCQKSDICVIIQILSQLGKYGHRHEDCWSKSVNNDADDHADAATHTGTVGMVTIDESEAQGWVLTVGIGTASHESMQQHMSVGDTVDIMVDSGAVRSVCERGLSRMPMRPNIVRSRLEAHWVSF